MYMKSSSTSKEGREEILQFISDVNQRYQEERQG
jgi:GTP-binding protein